MISKKKKNHIGFASKKRALCLFFVSSFHDFEAVVEEEGRLGEAGGHATTVEEDEVEGDAIMGDSRGEAITSLTGETRLDAKAAFVGGQHYIRILARHVALVD